MPPLPLLSGLELIALLGRLGYATNRQRGSHVRLTCPGRAPVTVPMHDTIDRGTLRSILRVTGVSVEELLALMHR